MDIIASKFEVGRSTTGSSDLKNWVNTSVTGGQANKLLTTITYAKNDLAYVIPVLSTATVKASATTSIGAHVAVNTFNFDTEDYTSMITWMNQQQAGVSAPAAPALSLLAAGTLTAQGSPSVRITYVTSLGETASSASASIAITDDHELVVASPAADAAGLATGYNVYIGALGSEKLQNTTPIALGTSYTLTAAPSTATAAAPATNATSISVLHDLLIHERLDETLATVIMSN